MKGENKSVDDREVSVANPPPRLQLRHYPGWLSYLTGFTCLAVGIYSQMGPKWMNRQTAAKCSTCADTDFEGALVQTFVMFIGEALCFPLWKADSMANEPKERAALFDFITDEAQLDESKTCPIWPWILASVFDCVGSTLLNIGTLITYASTVSMLRNLMIPVVAIFQMVLIKKAMKVHHIIGATCMTGALILSAVPSFQEPESGKYSQAKVVLGIFCCILGTTFQSFQIIFEETLFRKSPLFPPLKAIGIEGIMGLLLSILIAIVWHLAHVEDVLGGLYQLFHSKMLIILSIIYLFGSCIFNAAALATTKLGGGFMRGIMQASRAPIVWLVSLAVKWQDYENWNLASSIIFLLGFIVYANWTPVLRHKPFMGKPVHCFCTDPSLDDECQPGLKRRGSAVVAREETRSIASQV